MLKQRIITAVILGSAVVAALFLLPMEYLDLLVLLLVALASWEYATFFCWHGGKKYGFVGTIILTALLIKIAFGIISTTVLYLLYFITAIAALWWLLVPGVLYGYLLGRYHRHFSSSLIPGYIIFMGFWGASFLLLHHDCYAINRLWFLMLLLQVVASDSGAYFVGRFLGCHPLAAKISPKKTVEGVWGGIGLSLLVTLFFLRIVTSSVSRGGGAYLLLALVISIFTIIGDLYESMLKREAKVKDSGKVFPGHGGVYDRIDGLVAAAPIFVLIGRAMTYLGYHLGEV